jgi:hypothetical protein
MHLYIMAHHMSHGIDSPWCESPFTAPTIKCAPSKIM